MPKRAKRTVLGAQEREFVIRVREYFEKELQNGGPLLPLSHVVDRVAGALDIGRNTVSRITREKYGPDGMSENELSTPNKKRKAKPIKAIDDITKTAIKNHVNSYHIRSEIPSLKKLVKSLRDANLFNGGISLLLGILKNIGFIHKRVDKTITEDHDFAMNDSIYLNESRSDLNLSGTMEAVVKEAQNVKTEPKCDTQSSNRDSPGKHLPYTDHVWIKLEPEEAECSNEGAMHVKLEYSNEGTMHVKKEEYSNEAELHIKHDVVNSNERAMHVKLEYSNEGALHVNNMECSKEEAMHVDQDIGNSNQGPMHVKEYSNEGVLLMKREVENSNERALHVKEKDPDEGAVHVHGAECSRNRGGEAARGLYKDHEIKDELVIGPVVCQPRIQHVTEVCNRSFSEPQPAVEPTDPDKPHTCPTCRKAFARTFDLKRHTLTHTNIKPHTCDVCQKGFSRIQHLKEHRQTHNDVKPFACELCDKSFALSRDLKRHQPFHAEVKPYSCDICNKCFIRSIDYKRHKLKHSGLKPYSCDNCNKSFTRLTSLVEHKRIHSGVKPYSCDVCNNEFTRLAHLKEHKLIHEGVKPHVCEVCKKDFTHLVALKRHMKTHEGVSYKCELCEKEFKLYRSFTRHKLSHKQ